MAGFGAPYAELAAAARHFALLATETHATSRATAVLRDTGDGEILVPAIAALWTGQRNSMAAQTFAGMAVEAAINTFGTIHFGQQQFEAHFAAGPLLDRLQRMVRDALGKSLEANDEPAIQLASLNAKRNAIVHARSSEILPDAEGTLRHYEPTKRRRLDDRAAVEAVNEMIAIVKWLRELDFQAYHFLGEWPEEITGVSRVWVHSPDV